MKYVVTVNGKKFEVIVEQESGIEGIERNLSSQPAPAVVPQGANGEESILAPMPGTILKIKVKEGQAVKKGSVLFVLEAMKMENEIMAGQDGVVSKILVSTGTSVKTGDCLAIFK